MHDSAHTAARILPSVPLAAACSAGPFHALTRLCAPDWIHTTTYTKLHRELLTQAGAKLGIPAATLQQNVAALEALVPGLAPNLDKMKASDWVRGWMLGLLGGGFVRGAFAHYIRGAAALLPVAADCPSTLALPSSRPYSPSHTLPTPNHHTPPTQHPAPTPTPTPTPRPSSSPTPTLSSH